MEADEEFASIVSGSFPDERFETFEAWAEAQRSDDTEDPVSNLWQGGGQWILYGLALVYRLQVFVYALEDGALSTPIELVDARGAEPRAQHTGVVRLAALRGVTGDFFHFDVLVDASLSASEDAEPLAPAPSVRPLAVAPFAPWRPSHATRSARLLAWAALHVVCLAVCLSLPPNGDRPLAQVAGLAQQFAQQIALQMTTPASPIVFFEAVGGVSPIPGAGLHTSLPPMMATPEVSVMG